MIVDTTNERVLSGASAWEIAVKYSIGKLQLPEPPSQFVPSRMALTLTSPLSIELTHTLQVASLPFHHRDPFDRLLIAQAQVERLPIVTGDEKFENYDVEIIHA
jgi:PIN domain nuclease of toxin-antitoxin system